MNDDRDQTTIATHRALALAQLEASHHQIEELKKTNSDPAAAKWEYRARINYGGVFFTVITIELYDGNDRVAHVTVLGGGLSVGTGTTWGTAFMNVNARTLVGRYGSFQFNFLAVATNVQCFLGGGNFVGSVVGGGLGIGIGTGGGGGTWKND